MRMENNYNPDVLNCIANLSNDEVFTPPELVNQMLDLLPQDLFRNPETTFLDPFTKSGVFLREIVKRLDTGLATVIPDRQERILHIMHKQVFGIALTELTSLLARRTVYCSKYADSDHSIGRFKTKEGHILYTPMQHTWQNGRCKYCGASKDVYDRGDAAETYAYNFIHTNNPKSFFNNMTFDVIIGNPPYQLDDGGNSASAKPIYHLFVEQAKKLNPRYLCMIIPARWYTGGKGLDSFRDSMLSDTHIRYLYDYVNSKDCFPGLSVGGGICYFLWDRDNVGMCNYTTSNNGIISTQQRRLNEFPVFVRYNEAVNIIHKVLNFRENKLSNILSSRNPFGIPTSARGDQQRKSLEYELISSQGSGFISKNQIVNNIEAAEKFNVMITRVMSEHAGEPDKDGKFNVIATLKILPPKVVCTDSYIIGGLFNTVDEANNLLCYLRTKFVRFLLLQAAASINLSKSTYQFVPLQDFSEPWTDEKLYKKYNLSEEEIAFIESMIRPME
jgi:site-specific DNA-methyltransferase (adenine-specific)